MGQPKRMRNLVGILKDKVSLIKATLLLSSSIKPTTSLHVAVLRATAHHNPTEPPSENTVDDVLALGRHHRATAFAVVDALLRRVYRTRDAHVALKCLLTLHHILHRGQLPWVPPSGDQNLLNLSTFRDESDADTWQLSLWVRWYARFIDHTVKVICTHEHKLSSAPYNNNNSHSYSNSYMNGSMPNTLSPLTGQTQRMSLKSLVGMIEQICEAPESLHYQRISLVYEVMKLVGEDYRMILRQVSSRVSEFLVEGMVNELSEDGLRELFIDLKRLEDCKEKLFLMFLNKKKNDGVWDSIAQLRGDVERVKERREQMRVVVRTQGTELTRFHGGESRSSSSAIVKVTSGKRWLDVEWNPFVASLA